MKREARFAQWIAVLAVVLSLIGSLLWLRNSAAPHTLNDILGTLVWNVFMALLLAPLGALIVTRRSGNKVGWLLLIGALGVANPMGALIPATAPTTLTPLLFLTLWFDGWSWIPPIFVLFLIPLYFPTGHLPSPRWRWLPWLALGLWFLFATLTLLIKSVGPTDESWEPLPNPIGFVSEVWINGPFLLFWFVGLLTLLGGSVLSLFGRFRHAGSVERQQIKWLLLAGAQFVIIYSLSYFNSDTDDSWANFLFLPSALAIPVAVAVAILRYRLYDIDVLIRKTAVYTLLTAVLALVYFGAVVVLQTVVGRATGEQSPLIIVLSTLLVAALFSPLRQRLQAFIDRRFFRRKYDAARTLTRFAITVRDEVEIDRLTAELLHIVQETMQPANTSLWLKPAAPKASKIL